MNEFIEYILQFGDLNRQQIDFISGKANVLELRKDDYFAEADSALKQVGFLVTGVIRVYSYDDKGEEITHYFVDENHLILNWRNLDANAVLLEDLQAATDCKLIVFSSRDWNEFSSAVAGWEHIFQKIAIKHFAENLERKTLLVGQDATTRYLEFLKKYPALANRIPLSYIASYLGITQSSLSRIRKNIR